jgi:hypothetical protein
MPSGGTRHIDDKGPEILDLCSCFISIIVLFHERRFSPARPLVLLVWILWEVMHTHWTLSKIKGKFLLVLSLLSTTPLRRMESGCIGPGWRWVVNLTLRLLYPRYLQDRRLDGPQSRSGRYWKVKNLDPTGTRTPTLGRPARSQSYRLRYSGSPLYVKYYSNMKL